MSGELSKGHITKIFGGDTSLAGGLLQVIKLEKNPAGKWVAQISDSDKHMTCLFPGNWASKIEAKELMEGSVLQANKYVVNNINGKNVVVLLQFDVLQVDCVTIGSPKPMAAAASKPSGSGGFGGNRGFGGNSNSNNPFKKMSQANNAATSGDGEFQPVTALSPFQRDFKIKVRVTRKGPIKEWSNDRGTGKLFSVDLLDMHGGEIQATMFNDAADKFFATFEEGQVYIIKRGRVKVARKQFTHIKNDYSLDLSMESDVEFVGEDKAISGMKYDFKPLSDLTDMPDKSYVDVCGVCDQVSELQEFTSKAGKDLKKRGFRLADQSGAAVDCTLWGDQASALDPSIVGQVVCVKAARVSDFNGKSLSINKYDVNPEGVKEVTSMQQWWSSKGSSMNFNSMSTGGGGGGSKSDPPITIRDFESQGKGAGDSPDYFNLILTIKAVPVNPEKPPWYTAVPEEGIPAYKVVQSDDGASWYCEKNQKTYENYKCRYIMRMSAFDHTKEHWFNCYNDVAEKIIGKPANELEPFIKNQDEEGLKKVFQTLVGKQFNCRIRAKQEVYNDEARQRCDILAVDEINYAEENKRMLGRIQEMLAAA